MHILTALSAFLQHKQNYKIIKVKIWQRRRRKGWSMMGLFCFFVPGQLGGDVLLCAAYTLVMQPWGHATPTIFSFPITHFWISSLGMSRQSTLQILQFGTMLVSPHCCDAGVVQHEPAMQWCLASTKLSFLKPFEEFFPLLGHWRSMADNPICPPSHVWWWHRCNLESWQGWMRPTRGTPPPPPHRPPLWLDPAQRQDAEAKWLTWPWLVFPVCCNVLFVYV